MDEVILPPSAELLAQNLAALTNARRERQAKQRTAPRPRKHRQMESGSMLGGKLEHRFDECEVLNQNCRRKNNRYNSLECPFILLHLARLLL